MGYCDPDPPLATQLSVALLLSPHYHYDDTADNEGVQYQVNLCMPMASRNDIRCACEVLMVSREEKSICG